MHGERLKKPLASISYEHKGCVIPRVRGYADPDGSSHRWFAPRHFGRVSGFRSNARLVRSVVYTFASVTATVTFFVFYKRES